MRSCKAQSCNNPFGILYLCRRLLSAAVSCMIEAEITHAKGRFPMILKNQFMQIEIAAAGAELMHILDLRSGTELLWNGDPAYWKRRSPVLFPNVGKTYGNVMRIGGASYPTSQHGFARDMDFSCECADAASCTFLLKSDETTLARYPHPFELRIGYALEGCSLKVIWKVKNCGESTMAFTIGGHPAFCFDAGECKQDYMLEFPGLEKIDYLLLDTASGTALPEKVNSLKLENGCLPLCDELFAHDALILDDAQVSEVWLCRRDGQRRIGMICPGFPNYGVWSVQGAPFVCLEPWQGRCDDCGYEGEFADKPNAVKLDPGAEYETSYAIVLPE